MSERETPFDEEGHKCPTCEDDCDCVPGNIIEENCRHCEDDDEQEEDE